MVADFLALQLVKVELALEQLDKIQGFQLKEEVFSVNHHLISKLLNLLGVIFLAILHLLNHHRELFSEVQELDKLLSLQAELYLELNLWQEVLKPPS